MEIQMTPMKFTNKSSGNIFYGMFDDEERTIYLKEFTATFPNQERIDSFMNWNQAEETEMTPENFTFFKL